MSTPDITADVNCFMTTVRNISGVEMVFGFLGVHSRRLKVGQQYTVPGNLIDALAKSRRKFQALERAVAGFTDQEGNVVAPTLVVVATPQVHLYDPVHDVTKAISMASGSLGIADPCWGSYTSV